MSLLFHSQLIGQMKHQYSTGRLWISQQWLQLITVQQSKKRKKQIRRERWLTRSCIQDKNGCDTFLLLHVILHMRRERQLSSEEQVSRLKTTGCFWLDSSKSVMQLLATRPGCPLKPITGWNRLRAFWRVDSLYGQVKGATKPTAGF